MPWWDLAALENAYTVALVAEDNPATEVTNLSSTEVQNDGEDYAFDLLASTSNPAFKRRTTDFKDETEAGVTRLSMRAFDRLLRLEMRHSMPLELFLIQIINILE